MFTNVSCNKGSSNDGDDVVGTTMQERTAKAVAAFRFNRNRFSVFTVVGTAGVLCVLTLFPESYSCPVWLYVDNVGVRKIRGF